MTFVPHTDDDRRAMLRTIGVANMERLFDDVPADLRFPQLDLPLRCGEISINAELRALAERNDRGGHRGRFLGAGAYEHFRPATVDHVLSRSEFNSAYTPYQPEISQGLLQATFEYQSMICRLTGMQISNASHYDGASSLAEAVLFALHASRRERRQVVVSPTVHPQYRQILHTYLQGTDAEIVSSDDYRTEAHELTALLSSQTAAFVVQTPNFFGMLEALDRIAEQVHAHGALLIVVPDPIALGLFRPPGDYDADVVAAEGQSLGIPVNFGGPHLGIFATHRVHARRMIGRLAAETVDTDGQRGYVLTLATREQHVRREKATSNICTNGALSALAASVYLATLGKSGLREVARQCFDKSHYAAACIDALPGVSVNPFARDRPFFKEFVIELPVTAAAANKFLLEHHDIVGGYDLSRDYPELPNHLLIAVTEMNTRTQIDALVTGLEALLS